MKKMKMSDILYQEVQRRMELSEYHLLCIKFDIHGMTKEVNHHVMTALMTINPQFKYQDNDFCMARKQELERKYYNEFGRLKE